MVSWGFGKRAVMRSSLPFLVCQYGGICLPFRFSPWWRGCHLFRCVLTALWRDGLVPSNPRPGASPLEPPSACCFSLKNINRGRRCLLGRGGKEFPPPKKKGGKLLNGQDGNPVKKGKTVNDGNPGPGWLSPAQSKHRDFGRNPNSPCKCHKPKPAIHIQILT